MSKGKWIVVGGKIPFFSQYISFTLLLPLLFNSPFTKILLKLVSDIREIL